MSKSFGLGEVDMNTIEQLISEICTHLIAAGVLKQIAECGVQTKDIFNVSILTILICYDSVQFQFFNKIFFSFFFQPNLMYQWTHADSIRPQLNGPKTEYNQSTYTKCDQAIHNKENACDQNSEINSDECRESFVSIKNKLLSCELTTNSEISDNKNSSQHNQTSFSTNDPKQKTDDSVEVNDVSQNHSMKNGQILPNGCDKSKKLFVDTSTQTDVSEEMRCEKKLLALSPSLDAPPRPPPPPPFSEMPPPPPPPPPIAIFNNSLTTTTSNDKAVESVTTQQQTSQNNVSSTILSSASSFCVPPPPPMNGVPGPPPLPLPSGNMWFKSDSESFFFSKNLVLNCVNSN